MGIFDSIAQQLTNQVESQATQFISGELSSLATGALQSLLGITNPQAGPGSFNIDQFRNKISQRGEFARPDRFDVYMSIPIALQQATGVQMSDLNLLCEAAEFPSRDINMIEFRHYGFIKRIPHQNQYGTATFNFILTGDMAIKNLFDAWLDFMVPTNSGLVTYPLDDSGNPAYETVVSVNQYDISGNFSYSATLIDAVPVNVGALSTSWNHGDGYHQLPVTFNFRKWQSPYTSANVSSTDFGQSTGGDGSLPNIDSSGPNNFTNQLPTPNLPF